MLQVIVAILVFVISVVIAWLSGPVLHVQGSSLIALRIILICIGVIAAVIILYFTYRSKRSQAMDGNTPGAGDLDTLLHEAEKRLAAAQHAEGKSLSTLPLLYLLGDSNSAKTTSVLKSGLDPELIAGQVYRDQDVIATPVANLWYTQSTVFAEAGEAVRKSPALWNKLIRHTRPRAWRSAAGKQAPTRAAVVCVSAEQFLGAGAAEAVAASARSTNQMLRALSQQLGAEIPVYVVLTKLDRIPGFSEYVRNLSTEEAAQPLGMAFPRMDATAGLYVEAAMREATTALDKLLYPLGEFRLELLNRETDQKNIDAVYEFPRELRKLRNNLASYLVELARPSHLSVNPYLRGFYLTGVRAHIVEQMVSTAAAQPAAQPEPGGGATRMFSLQQMQQAAAPAAAPQTVARKIAQWCFLPHLFTGVILKDHSALAGSSSSGRTNVFRRAVFGVTAIILLIVLIGVGISWHNNSRLESTISSAANALPPENVPPTALASPQSLASLDQLRAAIVQIEDYQKHGAPFSYGWGIYHGDSLLGPARALYFDRFRRLLLTNTQANLVTALNALPATPAAGADYTAAYNPLKAYLITTSHPEKSTADFLTPVLMQYWLNGRVPDTNEQRQLAQRQFDFYATEIAHANPYSIAPQMDAVSHARAYLANFGGFERIYQQMITAANNATPSINFNQLYPGSAATVVDGHIVPGAFTSAGFTFMQNAIQHPSRYFSGETWVLGQQAAPSLNQANLTNQLAARYTSDYQSQWRAFLAAANVVRYRSLSDAAAKLQQLSNPASPLLALLFVVSHNTAVGAPAVAKEFQPAQAVVAPASVDKFVGPGNTAYINGLLGLQGAVAQVAQQPTAANNPSAVAPIVSAAVAAHTAASQTAQAFTLDPVGHVNQTVLALLQAPISSVDAVVRGRGPAEANAAGRSFCAGFDQIANKFPFSPRSSVEVSPAAVAALLQPGTGSLWQFYNASLKTVLAPQGMFYAPAPNSPIKLTPGFVAFFNRLVKLSAALYPSNPASGLTFTARILPSKEIQSITFAVDSQKLEGSSGSKQFTWSLKTAQQAELTANYGAGSLPLQFSGPWALFHLIDKGRPAGPGRLDYPLEFSNTPIVVKGTPLVVHLEITGPDASLLIPGGLDPGTCVSRVAQ